MELQASEDKSVLELKSPIRVPKREHNSWCSELIIQHQHNSSLSRCLTSRCHFLEGTLVSVHVNNCEDCLLPKQNSL